MPLPIRTAATGSDVQLRTTTFCPDRHQQNRVISDKHRKFFTCSDLFDGYVHVIPAGLGNICSILFYIVLYCSILFYIVLYCSILFYIVLYCPCHSIFFSKGHMFYIVLKATYCSKAYMFYVR